MFGCASGVDTSQHCYNCQSHKPPPRISLIFGEPTPLPARPKGDLWLSSEYYSLTIMLEC
jgi:hypothetical protein